MAESQPFTGFPAEGLQFLRTLGTKDKVWFDANRAVYDDAVVAPTKAFVVALGDRLAEDLSPDIVARPKTNGSIAPINNDLRFNPDRSPYKDHLDNIIGGELADALDRLGKGRKLDIAGAGLKRVPKPFDEDHPRAELLRIKGGIQARRPEPTPKTITTTRFVDFCARRLLACGDVHRWFVQHPS
jgi:hypothetical protein